MTFLITFIVLSIINVVFSTIRSITTIKSGKTVASLISGGYFAFYNVMLIYTVAEFPMWQKCLITFVCNVVGVWIVKFVEEKMKKDRLWKVETTVLYKDVESVCELLNKTRISYNYIEGVGKYTIFNIFCATQGQSTAVKEILKAYNVKYFVSESKTLWYKNKKSAWQYSRLVKGYQYIDSFKAYYNKYGKLTDKQRTQLKRLAVSIAYNVYVIQGK